MTLNPTDMQGLEGVEKEGNLQRKNELDEGGRKVCKREWKETVLCCFLVH